jgi:glyoxylase-like metal-dependent hydrolase (beta-lactamase superfamily II)
MPSTAPHRAAAPSPAPGVTRLGDAEVNFYLLEDPGGLVLVDGGLPGHLPQLQSHLEGLGRSLGDIRAVLLTHAHPDHTGAAAAARQAGGDVWVHQRDAAAAAAAAQARNAGLR